YFYAHEDEFGNVDYINKSLKLTQSVHYVVSYEKLLSEDWRLKGELYYQDISKLPVPNNPDKLFPPSISYIDENDTLINAGKGRNYGIEITVQKFFTKQYYMMFSASLFDSKYKPINGKWYNTRFNSNYIFNLAGGKEIKWGENKMISLNGKMLWSGGQRTLPVDIAASIESGETEYDLTDPFHNRLDDYFRLDLGIKLHFYKKKTEHIIMLDIQNVTNRMNSWYQYYSTETEKVEDYYMAGIIPILSYRIEF
ncbi:MAG: TonB-dependent receptor, partial [Salinivirgaceae bacterium]